MAITRNPMQVFKIARDVYAKAITASGAANRWNREGQMVSYAASSRALATLEMVARRAAIMPTLPYKMMVITMADDPSLYREVPRSSLPLHWYRMDAYPQLQAIGAKWYEERQSLVLKVPSAIIPQESNYIINTNHPEFAAAVQLETSENYFWDSRLL